MIPLRFSLAPVLIEPNEKGKLIMTAKMLQERFDKHLSDPCLPHLFAAMQGMSPADVDQDRNAEPAGHAEAPMSWCCAFNNLGGVEKRLRTHHGMITIENMCIGVRLRNFM